MITTNTTNSVKNVQILILTTYKLRNPTNNYILCNTFNSPFYNPCIIFVTFCNFEAKEKKIDGIHPMYESFIMNVCYEILYSKTRRHSFKFFFATRVFCRLIDADLTIQWTKNGFFWRMKTEGDTFWLNYRICSLKKPKSRVILCYFE